VQNSACLTHRPKFETGNKSRYVPVWILIGMAILCAFFGIWMFGRYPAAYLLSDTIFALVAILVLGGLTVVGAFMGGELQRRPGKLGMGLIGFWHGLLQLSVPLLLIRLGDWISVLLALATVLVVSGLSIPFTSIRKPGLGAWLMKLPEPYSKVFLTLGFVLYGGWLLSLPLLFHNRGSFAVMDPNSGFFYRYSSFLPQNAVDLVANFVRWVATSLNLTYYAPVWWLLIISMIAVVVLGFILSMSFLSWYFAVSLAFQGHNNEVGGAARIEKFKHVVRLRITRDDLTAFVIGIDVPKADGHKSEPKLIDVFTLRVT
jgi:hypothetical protein